MRKIGIHQLYFVTVRKLQKLYLLKNQEKQENQHTSIKSNYHKNVKLYVNRE